MSPAAARAIICEELGVRDLADAFQWIDLESPLGSASIAQVVAECEGCGQGRIGGV